MRIVTTAILVLLAGIYGSVGAATHYVNPGESIQAAINNAINGDEIEVAAGTYTENITLKDGVAIIGAGELVTTIDGGGAGSVVTSSGCGPDTVIEGFTITGGYAGDGGGMYNLNSSSPTVTNCVFTGNTASSDTYGGGGIFNHTSSPTVTNCVFSGNTAEWNGGGMYNFNNSSPTVTNCTFSGNSAERNGGGMYNNGGSPTVTNCSFSDNTAKSTGGGMCNAGSSPTVTDCTFSWNSAEWNGGGMYNLNSSSPTVTNCAFTGNTADVGGGMENYDSSPTVTDCTFSGNTADYAGGGMENNGSSPTLTNCTFSNNTGNGMSNYSSSPTLTNCTFSNNTFGGNGGGMYNQLSSPTLTNCNFTGNSAGMDGGGMYNYSNSSPTVTNCMFISNTAGDEGGGMRNWASSPTVVNSTFSDNSAEFGGGMSNNSSSPTVTNCIMWGDTSTYGPEIHNSSSSPTVTYSDIQGGWTGGGNINADPMFVLPGDYHIMAGSPCIDAGDNTAVPADTADLDDDGDTTEPIPFDLDGQSRFLDDCLTPDTGIGTPPIVDMGAYEFEGPTGIRGTVVGIDSAGKPSGPLAGAIVELSGQGTAKTDTTNSDGKFSFLNIPAGEYIVTITKSDYYGVNCNIYIEENETLHEVFQLAYKSGTPWPVGYDFLSPDGKHFIEGAPGDISFEITIAWNGEPNYVDFYSGDNHYPAVVEDLGGGLARASLTIDANDIVNNPGALTIDIVNGEGNHTYLKTDVRFHPVPEIINSWYEDNIPWAPSGLSLSYSDGKEWSWELPIESEDVSFDASVGYNRELSYDLMSGKFSGSLEGTGGFGLSWPVAGVTVLGEGEAGLAGTLNVCLNDGPPVITPGWQVSFTGKVGVEAPVILMVDVIFPPASPAVHGLLKVPVVKHIIKALKVRLFIIGGASIEGVYEGGDFGDCFLGSTNVDVSGTIGVEVQIEISAGRAAVGVYAGGTGTPSFQLCPDFELNSITINAYVGAYAKIYWFKISKRYGCTVELGGDEETRVLSNQLFGTALEGDVTWELASESLKRWGPANRPVCTEIRELASTPKTSVTGNEAEIIAENVFGTASPSVVSDASQTMLLFSLHDDNKPDYGASDIGTFISTGGGAWSAGRITDDLVSDFVAKVISIDSDYSYLAAWERISGDVSDLNDPNKIAQISPHLEIAASRFNRVTGVWSVLTEVTSNGFVDRAPLPIEFCSTTGIIWIQNDVNDMGNSEYGDRLMFSKWTGSEWGEPNILWSGPHGILSTSFASDSNNEGHIVFAVDLDGNTDDTRTDRELYVISTSAGEWETAKRLTNDDVEDSCPVIVKPNGTVILVWDCNDTLLYTPLLNIWDPNQVYSQYTLSNQAATLAGATMADGAAIAYAVQGTSGVDIMASFYDSNLDRWSLPRQLTFDEDMESAISLGFDGYRLIVAYLKTPIERKAVYVKRDNQIYHLENVPEPGRTDLCILQHTLGYDLSVDSNSVVLEPVNPEPGLTATIKATIENSGDLGVENIAAVFYDGEPNSGGSIIGDTQIIYGNLIPGGANEVSVSWDVPADSGSHEIFVVVDPCLAVDDRDRSNNTASKFAALPDVEVENAWSTELSPNSVMLIARIANTGVTAAKNVTVSWRIGSEQGTEIGSDLISTLACGGAYEASCVWDTNGVFDSNDYVKVFGVASPASGVPEFDERNNVFSLVINNPGLVNHSPVACIVGGDRSVEAGEGCEAAVVLDGSCSSDVDSTPGTNDDIVSFDWYLVDSCEPGYEDYLGSGEVIEVNLPLGENIIVLEVTDTAGAFDSNEVTITVEDVTGPEIVLNGPDTIILECGLDSYIEEGATATDNCDGSVEVIIGGDTVDTASCGTYIISYDAADSSGNQAVQVVRTVIVEDTIAPEFILTVEPEVLTPHNHEMVLITPVWDVNDNCDKEVEVSLLSITSSQGEDGIGDGHTTEDILVTEEGLIYLRAEIGDSSEDRIYTLSFEAVDDSGNSNVQSAIVVVPVEQLWRHRERYSGDK